MDKEQALKSVDHLEENLVISPDEAKELRSNPDLIQTVNKLSVLLDMVDDQWIDITTIDHNGKRKLWNSITGETKEVDFDFKDKN